MVDVQAVPLNAATLCRFGGESEVRSGAEVRIGEPSSSSSGTGGGEDDGDRGVLRGCDVEPVGQQICLDDVGVGSEPVCLARRDTGTCAHAAYQPDTGSGW